MTPHSAEVVRAQAEGSRVRSPSVVAHHRLLLLASDADPGYHVSVESFLAQLGRGWSFRYGHRVVAIPHVGGLHHRYTRAA
jgi:hypothetical protein